jgi:hypothetical protein
MVDDFKLELLSEVLMMSGLLKSEIFFIVHRNSKMDMTTSLLVVSRKKKRQ